MNRVNTVKHKSQLALSCPIKSKNKKLCEIHQLYKSVVICGSTITIFQDTKKSSMTKELLCNQDIKLASVAPKKLNLKKT